MPTSGNRLSGKRLGPGCPGWRLWQGPRHETLEVNQGKGLDREGRKDVGGRDVQKPELTGCMCGLQTAVRGGKVVSPACRTSGCIF